jgi:dGTPase
VLGRTHRERINRMVLDLIETNWEEPCAIRMSPEVQAATDRLREFLFERVYVGSEAKKEEAKARHVVQKLYFHFLENPEEMPADYYQRALAGGAARAVCDYIAGMTDRFAIRVYEKYFLPRGWVD